MIGNRIVTIAIATIMISTVFGGCLSNPFKPEDNYDDELLLPEWKKGYYWEYAVKTAGRELSTTMVVSIDDDCLLYTSPSPRDVEESRMPSSA